MPGHLRRDSHWSEGLDWGFQHTASHNKTVRRTDKAYKAAICRSSLTETQSTQAGCLSATRRRRRITQWSHLGQQDLQTCPRKTRHEYHGNTCPTGSCFCSGSSSGYIAYNIAANPNTPIAAWLVTNVAYLLSYFHTYYRIKSALS